MKLPDRFQILIITLSDRAFKGEYADLSGPKIRELITGFFLSAGLDFEITLNLLPDEKSLLKDMLLKATKEYHIILTTGGTGIGPRDITADTVIPMLDKEIPGIMEFIRIKYAAVNTNALLSRGVAGIIGKSLIYTLPGSVSAVEEYMSEIVKTLKHTIFMQYGVDKHQSG